MRIRFTLDITRTPKAEPQGEPIFEHRDNFSVVEATYGGDQRAHRMGFVLPTPTPDED